MTLGVCKTETKIAPSNLGGFTSGMTVNVSEVENTKSVIFSYNSKFDPPHR